MSYEEELRRTLRAYREELEHMRDLCLGEGPAHPLYDYGADIKKLLEAESPEPERYDFDDALRRAVVAYARLLSLAEWEENRGFPLWDGAVIMGVGLDAAGFLMHLARTPAPTLREWEQAKVMAAENREAWWAEFDAAEAKVAEKTQVFSCPGIGCEDHKRYRAGPPRTCASCGVQWQPGEKGS